MNGDERTLEPAIAMMAFKRLWIRAWAALGLAPPADGLGMLLAAYDDP